MGLFELQTFFIGLSAIASVIMLMMIKQLNVSIKRLSFQAIDQIYNEFSKEMKSDYHDIINWSREDKNPQEVLNMGYGDAKKISENKEKLRHVSVALNRAGYSVYKDFINVEYLQEQFGGMIITSFLAMKPYLKYYRDQNEGEDNPVWDMRRYYLLLVVACEKYHKKNFEPSFMEILEQYGDNEDKKAVEKEKTIVPVEWLHKDIKRWLVKNKFLTF